MSGSQTNSVSCHTKCVNELFLLLVFFCVASPTTCSVRLNFCDKRLLSVRCVQIPINSCHSTAIILLIVFFALVLLVRCLFCVSASLLLLFIHSTNFYIWLSTQLLSHPLSLDIFIPHHTMKVSESFFFLFSSVVQCWCTFSFMPQRPPNFETAPSTAHLFFWL